MKRLVTLLTAMIIVGTSQANTIHTQANGSERYGKATTTESSAKTVIKKDRVLAKSPRVPKPKLFRANPHRVVHYSLIDDQDDIFVGDDDIAPLYRRRDLGKIQTQPSLEDPEGILTEDVRWKLFLARTAAMIKYRQIHS